MQVDLKRKLVSNGWTINNRRQLQSIIGKEKLTDLASEFELLQRDKGAIGGDIFVGQNDFYKLINDGKNLKLKLGIFGGNGVSRTAREGSAIILENENITIANIAQKIDQFYKKMLDDHSMWEKPAEEVFGEPKTMAKLYSPEFKPTRRINEDGYFVTTIIDKKTGKPVEAYVKQVNPGKQPEEWYMFVKNKKGKYERVGWRKININLEKKKLVPEWMESSKGSTKYSGIGIRLHQLGVERMLQSGCETIEIDSLSSAFTFHYKCGFRSPNEVRYIGKKSSIDWWLEDNGISLEEWEKFAKPTYKEDDMVYVNAQGMEEIKKLALIKNKGNAPICNTIMYLKGDFLNKWVERAKSQPILLDYAKA